MQSNIRRTGLAFVVIFLAGAGLALAGSPAHFISRGPGGGGAFFGPAINPFNTDEVWIGSDMSDLFHSTDFGRTWDTVDFRRLLGGSQPGRMEFTSNPQVRYALNGDVPARSLAPSRAAKRKLERAAPGFAVRSVERIYKGLCAACSRAGARGRAMKSAEGRA